MSHLDTVHSSLHVTGIPGDTPGAPPRFSYRSTTATRASSQDGFVFRRDFRGISVSAPSLRWSSSWSSSSLLTMPCNVNRFVMIDIPAKCSAFSICFCSFFCVFSFARSATFLACWINPSLCIHSTPLASTCCYARFTLPLYYLPYPGIELPTSLQYWSLLITTLLILSIVPGLDSRTALWLSTSCLPHGKPFTMHIAQPCI